LLDLSRIDRGGQVRWRMARIDLVSTIKQALAPLYSHTRVGNIHLRFNPPPPLPVVADADRIQQVITNLVGNAIKYTPPGGRIEVAAVVVDGKVRVSVADTGPGMSQEVCAHVFDRFYRASGDTSSGLGLGLTIAREIVIHHKGDIWVESEPGAGSTFFFTLPLAAEAAITTTDAKESAGM
jgi:signal transduction histidine kinase